MLLRRHPIPLLVAILAAGLFVPVAILALVPLYWVAADRGVRAGAVGAAGVVAAQAVWMSHWVEAVFAAVSSAAVVAAARVVVMRRELLAEAAATEERLRIARELHDAVGHDVALMVVQAEALAAVTGDERADAIATLGRHTMGELHRTLKVLREEAPTEPQPSVADLGAVLAGARAAGVPVTLAVEGAPRALPAALDASAYRIVQEAVTNVIRHAHGAPAAVTVHYGERSLGLTVTDTGGGAPSASNGGHGLIGMRERAAAFGGTLTAGPREHGYTVHAELPYDA
jgi:signal transduction histidine kinase